MRLYGVFSHICLPPHPHPPVIILSIIPAVWHMVSSSLLLCFRISTCGGTTMYYSVHLLMDIWALPSHDAQLPATLLIVTLCFLVWDSHGTEVPWELRLVLSVPAPNECLLVGNQRSFVVWLQLQPVGFALFLRGLRKGRERPIPHIAPQVWGCDDLSCGGLLVIGYQYFGEMAV